MAKKQQNPASLAKPQFLEKLDFTASQKQVDALMKTVLHDNTLNEHKICFIQEQLHDHRYQINPKIIAKKMFEHLDSRDLKPEEASLEVE
jgi:hypothetical protein